MRSAITSRSEYITKRISLDFDSTADGQKQVESALKEVSQLFDCRKIVNLHDAVISAEKQVKAQERAIISGKLGRPSMKPVQSNLASNIVTFEQTARTFLSSSGANAISPFTTLNEIVAVGGLDSVHNTLLASLLLRTEAQMNDADVIVLAKDINLLLANQRFDMDPPHWTEACTLIFFCLSKMQPAHTESFCALVDAIETIVAFYDLRPLIRTQIMKQLLRCADQVIKLHDIVKEKNSPSDAIYHASIRLVCMFGSSALDWAGIAQALQTAAVKPQMKRLCMVDCSATDVLSMVAVFLHILNLQYFQVCGTTLDVKACTIVSTNLVYVRQLRHLVLENCSLSASCVVMFRNYFPYITNLLELDLSFNMIDDIECAALANQLRSLPALRVLNLAGNRFTPLGTTTLFENLRSVPGKLDSLCVSDVNPNSVDKQSILRYFVEAKPLLASK